MMNAKNDARENGCRYVAKRYCKFILLALLSARCLANPRAVIAAQVTPANTSTSVYNAQNGVPVVDIANPNGKGLSHNEFLDYNVERKGLVLNNGDSSQLQRQSQLAGAISANLHLRSAADLILNEVVSTNRSTLAGYTEVVGPSADVVVANQNGITCKGCGFINTPKVTLTTGAPVIGSTGALQGFNVNDGDILITGNGIDASKQDYLGLMARSLRLEAQINAKALDIIAGANDIDYATKVATPHAAADTGMLLAIDSSALGGMYADRIRLVATEAGVGVRMLGDAAAGVGDFTLDAVGKIEVGSRISAKGDLRLASTAGGSDALKESGASLTAQGDMTLAALGGNIHLQGGALTAMGDMTMQSASLTDTSSSDRLSDNNKRYAAGNLTLTQSGAVALNGTSLGAGGVLSGSADTLSVGPDGESLYGNALLIATNGDLALAGAAVRGENGLTLNAETGAISTSAASGQGIVSTAGDVNLAAGGGVTNAGAISVDNGALIVKANGTVTNSGTIHAANTATFTDKSGGRSENIDNSGTLVTDGGLSVKAASLMNSGNLQGTDGSTFTLASLTNSGKLITSANAAKSATISADTLTNSASGILQSARDLNLYLKNSLTNSYKILAEGDLSILASDGGTTLALANNSGGIMQAGGTLTAAGMAGGHNLGIGAQFGALLGNDVVLNVSSLSNDSYIQAANDLVIDDTGDALNNGKILSQGTLSLGVGGTLTNNDRIQARNGADITVGTLNNNAIMYLATAAGHDATVTADTLNNDSGGIIEAARDLTLTAGDSLYNGYKILAGRDLTVTGENGSSLSVVNDSDGVFGAGNTLSLSGYNGGDGATLDIQKGKMLAKRLALHVSSLTNDGTIQGGTGASTVEVTNNLTNNSGATLNLAANASGSGTVRAKALTNNGTLQSAGDLDLAVTNTLTDGNGVKIIAARDLTMNVGSLALGDSNSQIIAGQSGSGTGSITIGSAFTNPGLLFSGGDLNVYAPSIINGPTGGIAAVDTLLASATAGDFDNFGALYAGVLLDTRATGTFTNEAVGTMDGGQNISIAAHTFINSNYVHAGRNLSIEALHFYNQVPGGDQRYWTDGYWSTTHTGWDSDPDWLFWGDHAYDYYTQTWRHYQYYSVMPPAVKPELVANAALTINGFQTALNLGAVISAPTITIASNQAGAHFTNDDYGLTTQCYTRTWYKEGHWGGDWGFTWVTSDHNNDTTSHTDTATTYGGGIYTTTLHAAGFGLSNISSPYTATITEKSGSGSLAGEASAGGGADEASGTSGTSGASAVTVGGITVNLPANPNGFFIRTKDPNAKYLVETNPLYSVGSTFLGSSYMLDRFGVDPDTVERRLGDANYEASLIRQQLLNVGAASLLNATNEADAMQKLMDNGADQGKVLGLTVGVAPTEEQLASLDSDLVWMVDTVVAGQHVLVPVVYLSAATRAQIVSGAVILASNANMNLTSLSNTGGTISGSKSLNIRTQGDITNTSGTIKGGNVALTSTQGNIVNQTATETTGGAGNQHTNIGGTAGIEATGSLRLDAKDDITNKGANMSAGGDASLNAGNSITFDTVQDKESSQTHSGSNSALIGGTATSSTTSSTTNIKSGLSVGGNLRTDSGEDTTFAGTEVNVGGNANVKAGGDLNVIARSDSTETSSSSKSGTIFSGTSSTTSDRETTNVGSNFNVGGNLNSSSKNDTTIQGSNVNVGGNGSVTAGGKLDILAGQNTSDTASSTSHSGLGVGGGIYGVQGTTDTNQKSTSVASNVNFGGKGSFKAGEDMTVQGSNVATGGDMEIKAKDVKVLEGRNTETSSHSETTTTFGKLADSSSSSASGAQAGASSGSGNRAAGAKAEASANAEANASGGVTLFESSTTTTTRNQSHAVGSNLSSGGNLDIKAEKDVTVRGSNVNAGGDASVDARNVNILAARNIDVTSTSSSDVKIGLYGDSANKAGASADAGANAKAGGEGSPSVGASANAKAEASTDNTLDIMRSDKKTDTTVDITHTGSSISSGGNLDIKARKNLNVNGSALESGGDMALDAKNMNFTAATDSHLETKTESATKAGLYLSGNASASAEANAGAQGASAKGGAGAEAEANASVGLYGSNTTTGSVEGSTTARTSSLRSGGNMTRTAKDAITDQGTQIDAGGNFSQSATTWESKAAKNTTFSSSSSETNTAKLGLYAKANAGASVDASTAGGAKNDSDAGASAGLEASYSRSTDDRSASASKAVVSNIRSGGGMTSTTTGKTSLEGTNMNSGGDLNLNAGSLDYKAAQDTTSTSGKTSNIDAGIKVGVDASKAVDFGASGGYKQDKNNSSTSTAVTGGMTSGGNLHVNTKGDANFEGTNLSAKNDAAINAGGDANFTAARNTATSSDTNLNASGSLSLSKSKGSGGKDSTGAGLELAGGYGTSSSSKSDAVTGSISSGGNLSVTSGKSATFEGTNLSSGGDTSVAAKDDVNFKAAKSTSDSSGWDVSGKASFSKGGTEKGEDGKEKEKDTKGSLGLKGGYFKDNETTSAASSIDSGGKVTVKSGKDVNLEGTNIASIGSTTLDAGHDVNFKAATNTSDKLKVGGSLDLSASSPAKGGKGEGKQEGPPSPGASSGKSTVKPGAVEGNGPAPDKGGTNVTIEQSRPRATSNVEFGGTGSSSNKGADAVQGSNGATGTHSETTTSFGKPGDSNASSGNASEAQAGSATKKKGNLALDLSGGTSTTRTGGSISAGSIDIKSGHDTTLEGTKTDSKGATSINAGGNVKLAAAESTHVEGGIGGSIGSKGGGLSKASIGGGVDNQGVDMKSGGDTNITSGGKTTMEGTTINADGRANIDAQGGLEEKSVVSGGGDLGLDHAGADLKVKKTEINAKGNNLPPAAKPPAQVRLEKEFDRIKNDPKLSPAQRVKMMEDRIKNDPDLTRAQKDKMLADLAAQQKKSASPPGR